MTQAPQRWDSSGQPTARQERHFEKCLEKQLLLLPEPLHYDLLNYFCCLNFSQRRNFILETLNRIGIAYNVLRTGNAFHIIVKPEYDLQYEETEHKLFQAKCFVAHYDRRLQTPGANDNSAAVWHLLNLAAQMQRERPLIKTPMQIILTDHEELRAREHLSEQGSYLLGQYLRNRNHKLRYVFFVFDQCGIGDTLCYLPSLIGNKQVKKYQGNVMQYVKEKAIAQIDIAQIDKYQYYISDNLGLNLWDYPALLFSTLPRTEVQTWQETGEKPLSWRTIHTQEDTPDLLEARSFALMNQVLSRLSRV